MIREELRFFILFLFLGMLFFSQQTDSFAQDADASSSATPETTATPTSTPSSIPSASPEPSGEPTPTPSATALPSPSADPTPSPEPTLEPSPTPSASPTVKPSPSPEPTVTPQPSTNPTPSPEPTAQPSPTPVNGNTMDKSEDEKEDRGGPKRKVFSKNSNKSQSVEKQSDEKDSQPEPNNQEEIKKQNQQIMEEEIPITAISSGNILGSNTSQEAVDNKKINPIQFPGLIDDSPVSKHSYNTEPSDKLIAALVALTSQAFLVAGILGKPQVIVKPLQRLWKRTTT